MDQTCKGIFYLGKTNLTSCHLQNTKKRRKGHCLCGVWGGFLAVWNFFPSHPVRYFVGAIHRGEGILLS